MKEKEIKERLLDKFGITELNNIQTAMLQASAEKRDIVLLSPTGTGKTIAFVMPVLKKLKEADGRIQCLVVVPTRELVIQIGEVFRALAANYKVTLLYGGHKVEDEVNSLKVTPDIVVSTPGRLVDHINRRNVNLLTVRILVLDEYDKCIELGFEDDLKKIMAKLKNVSRIILTSATRPKELPEFLKLKDPVELDFTQSNSDVADRTTVYRVESVDEGHDKLRSLGLLLTELAMGKPSIPRTIIFVNHRESAERVYGYLKKEGIDAVLYHGALNQRDREMAVARFNNGSSPILVATDLAARGLDIKGVENVVHYHQALTPEVYTHRNGRTSRVDEEGNVYILVSPGEKLKDFGKIDREFKLTDGEVARLRSGLLTFYVNAGKKEKVSKGDILGFLTKEVGIPGSDIGKIDVYDHYSIFCVASKEKERILEAQRSKKLKGERRKISLL